MHFSKTYWAFGQLLICRLSHIFQLDITILKYKSTIYNRTDVSNYHGQMGMWLNLLNEILGNSATFASIYTFHMHFVGRVLSRKTQLYKINSLS